MKKIRRLIAIYIDFFITFYILYFPLLIINNTFKSNIIISNLSGIIFLAAFAWLFLNKDLLFKNASLGKRMMGLKIYCNNEMPNKNTVINRNVATAKIFPLYIFYILFTNKSAGDFKYNTEVK